MALRGRRETYGMLVGVAVGVLVTGLALPFVVGERVGTFSLATAVDMTDELEVSGGGDDTLAATPEDGVSDGTVPDAAAGTTSPDAGTTGAAAPGPTPPAASPGAAEPSPAAPAPGRSSGPLRATDVGVTGEKIAIGFLLLDVGSLGRLGISVPDVSPEQQRAAFEAQLGEVNDRGGVNGREVVGVYETFDALSQDDMGRACLALREKKPFAIVAAGGFTGPAILCVVEQGSTPLVAVATNGTPTEYVRRAQGRLFSMFPVSDRTMANWSAELDRLGVLAGKRIGILSQESSNPGDTIVKEVNNGLRRVGQEPVHVSRLSADQNTAASQVPVEVQQMRSKRVDLVMILTSTLAATSFVQAADQQGFRPRYTFTDWGSMNNDVSNQNMPESYDGTIGITAYRVGEEKIGVGPNAAERECRRMYESGTGDKLGAKGSNDHGLIMGNCTALHSTTLGLGKAGTELTRASFSQGMQSVGPFPMTMWGGGSFSRGKFGAADLVRTIRWFADCRCLKPTDNFRPGRF